jgi:hypothetical protein
MLILPKTNSSDNNSDNQNVSISDSDYATSAKNVDENALNYLGQGVKSDSQHSYVLQKDAQLYNSEEARLNREFQEYMSNTSYQRAVQDMIAAGINPALAYQQGGASTPSGSAASTSANSGSSRSMVSTLIGGLLNSAINVAGLTFGKAIGAKLAGNNASAMMADQLENQIFLETFKHNLKNTN